MIILLHGGGALGMSQKTSQIKKGFDPLAISELSGKNISFKNARVEFLNEQLFAEKKLVILEDFLDLDLGEIEDSENFTLVLKFNKLLSANQIILKTAKEKKIQVISFEEKGETSMFPFLDMLGEKNSKAFGELEKFRDEWGAQYVLTMICYLLRRLVILTKKAPVFVQQKLEKQKKNFSLREIKFLYKFILESDFKIKSGLLNEKMALTLIVNKFILKT